MAEHEYKHVKVVSFDKDRLASLRKLEARMTQVDMADVLQIDKAILSRLESGAMPMPSIDLLYRISKYFEVPMEEWLLPTENFNTVFGEW